MRQTLTDACAWCYDLLWYLADLRYRRPQIFVSIVALLIGLLAAVPVVLLTLGGNQSQPVGSDRSIQTNSAEGESTGSVRYVPYNGLAQSRAQGGSEATGLPADLNQPSAALQRLTEVLKHKFDDSDLIYGSDGSEGSILPLDNGVVPSSGPRFATAWELIVPSAGIRAAVVQVGLTTDGAMGSPDNPFVVGWFNRSALPGELGNALLGGHRDYQDRDGHIDVGVCWELDKTRVGDQLIMHDESTSRYYVYDIVDIATIRPDSKEAVKYLSQTKESVVTLITCSGDFDEATHSYEERIVVVALLTAIAAPDL